MSKNLVTQLCDDHKCPEYLLEYYVDRYFDKTIDFLKNKGVRTIHLKQNFYITFNSLTWSKTKNLYAFKGFMGITVPQYYYTKHKIILKFTNLPCVRVLGGNGHVSYFPLEVLEAV